MHTLSLPLREDGAQLAGHALIVTLGTRAAQTVAAHAPRSLVLHTLLPRSAFDKLPSRGDEISSTRLRSSSMMKAPIGTSSSTL